MHCAGHGTCCTLWRGDVQEDKASPSQVSVQEPTHLPDALVEEVDVALGAHEHEAEHSGTEATQHVSTGIQERAKPAAGTHVMYTDNSSTWKSSDTTPVTICKIAPAIMNTPLKKLIMRMTAITLSADQSLTPCFLGGAPAAGAAAAGAGAAAALWTTASHSTTKR